MSGMKSFTNTRMIGLVSQATKSLAGGVRNLAAIPMMTISCAGSIGRKRCYDENERNETKG